MKGYRFYSEPIGEQYHVIALALDDEGTPIAEGAEVMRAYDRDGLLPVNPQYLRLYCRRISERKARELSPALFQELERD